MLQQIILIFHLLFAIALIALVLVQQGKGAGMGASFGSGASQTVFGSQGSGSFLIKLTGGLAALFFATSLFLSYLSTKEMKTDKALTITPATQQQTVKPVVVTPKKQITNTQQSSQTPSAVPQTKDLKINTAPPSKTKP